MRRLKKRRALLFDFVDFMYKTVLIANRADCAARLIQACQKLHIRTVLIAARDECAVLPLRAADEVIDTGFSRDAYTDADNILQAARQSNAEAILPGWGFLSEEMSFARRARLMGLHFIGPSDAQLQNFGDKKKTLDLLLPLLGLNQAALLLDDAFSWEKLSPISPPWMVKGRFGGGGKQVEKINDINALKERIRVIRQQNNGAYFFIEHAEESARHIEFQIFGDGKGVVHLLGARDCTAQCHCQKWLEFSVDWRAQASLCAFAHKVEQALGEVKYSGWGTVECLWNEARDDIRLLEINPRLQVEHGVTEMSSSIDLVEAALVHGSSGCDPFSSFSGCGECFSVEFRLFARGTGKLSIGFDGCEWPHHPFEADAAYRLETGYADGSEISGVYDGMIARFLVSGAEAFSKLKRWVSALHVSGVETNIHDLMSYDAPHKKA